MNISIKHLSAIAELQKFKEMNTDALSSSLKTLLTIEHQFNSFFVLNSTGWYVASSTNDLAIYQTQSYAELDIFSRTFEGNVNIAAPQENILDNSVTVSIGVPIYSYEDKVVGVLIGIVDMLDYIQSVYDYSFEEGVTALVVDQTGVVFAHSDIDLSNLKDGPLSINYSSQHYVQKVIEGESGQDLHDFRGELFFGSWISYDNAGWGVVLMSPQQAIIDRTNVLTHRLLSINLIVFVSTLGVSIILTRRITARAAERSRLEVELFMERVHVEQEKELSKLKTRFMSTATHELRTPLASIMGYTELIQDTQEALSETQRLYFGVIQRNVHRLSVLTDDLLDLQRLEEGRMSVTLEQVNVFELLELVKNEFTPILANKKQTLEIRCIDIVLNLDKLRVMQVLINLLSNASKFSPEGGEIVVDVVEKVGGVQFSVSDAGVGIGEEDIGKLFSPFPGILVDGNVRGTGLGLSICKGIVELHDGTIWAESDGLNLGSTFTFVIPFMKREMYRKLSLK